MIDLERLKRLEAAATESLGPFEDGRTRAVELFEQALRNVAPAIISEIEALRRDKARIDGLEAEMKIEPLVLHDCSGPKSWPSRMRGLGLIPSKPRTLRQSLDSMLQLPQPAPEVKP